MKCSTHIVCANALALAFIRPDNPTSLLLTLGAATIGGTISDIDVSDKDHKGYIKSYIIITVISIVLLIISDIVFHIGINNWIIENSSYSKIIICFILSLFLCYFGYLNPHRSFLHSFLGIGLLILLCYISLGSVVIPFIIGIISHIFLDLLNKKGLWLFYPLKRKYSLKLCVYNGKVNNYLFDIFSALFIIELIILNIFWR